jgi:hypothetical protein
VAPSGPAMAAPWEEAPGRAEALSAAAEVLGGRPAGHQD